MAKQEIPTTHYLEEEPVGTYLVRCGNPDCENCNWMEYNTKDRAEQEAADLNLMEAASADIIEEVKRMAEDYGIPAEKIIDFFEDVRWLREVVECPAK